MSEWNPVPDTQRSMPPEGFIYPKDYRPDNDDDWYPVHVETGDPMPSALSGYRRMGGVYVPMQSQYESGKHLMPGAQGSVVPLKWKASADKPLPVIQCMKIKKDGNRCGRWSRRGGQMCIMHEAKNGKMLAAKKVENARLRLVGMADDAINVLDDLIKPGTNDAIRLKAAQDILDRSGIKGTIDMKMETTVKIDPGASIEARLAQIAERNAIENVVDGEVIEDDEEE